MTGTFSSSSTYPRLPWLMVRSDLTSERLEGAVPSRSELVSPICASPLIEVAGSTGLLWDCWGNAVLGPVALA